MRAIFFDHLFRSLSWTFIHSLWQGLILSILAGMVICFTRKASASIRYGLLSILFIIFLAASVITFLFEWNTGSIDSSGLVILENLAENNLFYHHSVSGKIYENLVAFTRVNADWIVFAWLVVLSFKLVRMFLDLIYIRKIRRQQLVAPPENWEIKFRLLACQFGIKKRVIFMQSSKLDIPAVVGYLKPMVLIPAGLITHLPAGEIEAILIHELAHIRRHDYLVNFIQRLAELIFFFNPGLLWVSAVLRIERENCCDDFVISNTKNKAQYINAIISFKEYSIKTPSQVVGFFGNQNKLLQRMTRMVYGKNKTLSPVELGFVIVNLLTLVLLLSVFSKNEITNPVIKKTAGLANNVQSLSYVSPINSGHFSKQSRALPEKLRPAKNGRHFTQQVVNFDEHFVNLDQQISRNKTNGIEQYEANTEQLNSGKRLTRSDEGIAIIEINPELSNKLRFANNNMQVPAQYKEKYEQEENALIHYKLMRMQADKDREQAARDRRQAEEDRLQAVKDRQQADLDRMIADRDREQAAIDRLHAEKERERIKTERLKEAQVRTVIYQ